MIYIITDREIKSYESLEEINEEECLLIDKEELHSIGADYIVKLTNKDIDFLIDKHKISNLAFERLYGKRVKPKGTTTNNNNSKLIIIGLSVLSLVSICLNAFLIGVKL